MNESELYKLRHSLAHVMAQAVLTLQPDAQLAFGPPVDNGCYYDFKLSKPLTDEDLPLIEREMERIIKEDQKFDCTTLDKDTARAELLEERQTFKVEHLDFLISQGNDSFTFYKNGPFRDLCRGPHLETTKAIPRGCFKVDSIAGAYWKGDEKNPQLTRIYCLAFATKDELIHYCTMREEAKKRDHRLLGRELDLYSIKNEEVGAGLVLWHPKGALVRHLFETYLKEVHLDNGYEFVYTPHIGRSTLWETSGHLDFYKEGMFPPIELEEQEFYLKPMNCPFHCHIFKSGIRSYRELPLRFAEWGTVYRFERSGTLHGLNRVRGFTQDDAHIFCHPDEASKEISRVVRFSLQVLKTFGFENFHLYLSTRPEKRIGEEKDWDAAENALRAGIEETGLPYTINEADGAFYGPKIDVQLEDAIGRKWQLSTIQFDFNLPSRFEIGFTDVNGENRKPYMIHRALLGSTERFMAILVEHLGGAFPSWLAPVQVALVGVHSDVYSRLAEIESCFTEHKVRYERFDDGSFNKRIRHAITQKIPYTLILGNKDLENGTISIRPYGSSETEVMKLEEFVAKVKNEYPAKFVID